MNTLLMSLAKMSTTTSSGCGSDSTPVRTVRSSDSPPATAVSATNVRVVRSLMSSDLSRVVMPPPR